MKHCKKLISVPIMFLFVAIMTITVSFANDPINFYEGIFTYENGEYYLTTPEVSVDSLVGWVKWKLNLNTAGWEIYDVGLSSDVKGTYNATGKYVYNAQKGILFFKIKSTNFLVCGLTTLGVTPFYVTMTQATSMVLNNWDPDENYQIICTRDTGTFGDIRGTWTFTSGVNTYSMTLNSDNSFIITGNIVQCSVD